MITIVELGEDRHDLIRAVTSGLNGYGQRQVGYALPVERGEYLVRVAGRGLAFTMCSRDDAIAALKAAKTP